MSDTVELWTLRDENADLRRQLAEAVRLLRHCIHTDSVLQSLRLGNCEHCRAAARFVAEHGKKEA